MKFYANESYAALLSYSNLSYFHEIFLIQIHFIPLSVITNEIISLSFRFTPTHNIAAVVSILIESRNNSKITTKKKTHQNLTHQPKVRRLHGISIVYIKYMFKWHYSRFLLLSLARTFQHKICLYAKNRIDKNNTCSGKNEFSLLQKDAAAIFDFRSFFFLLFFSKSVCAVVYTVVRRITIYIWIHLVNGKNHFQVWSKLRKLADNLKINNLYCTAYKFTLSLSLSLLLLSSSPSMVFVVEITYVFISF